MDRCPLGDSGLEVSLIGLGTSAMGGKAAAWGHVDDRESIAAIHQALDCGINLVDTAPTFGQGHSEIIVGRAIQGRRDGVIIASKCGLLPPESEGGSARRDLAGEVVLRQCEQSLRRLRTDFIDLYVCHWPDPSTPLRDTMEALKTLRTQGKIRAIGLSNFSCEQIAAAYEFGPIHAVQPALSILSRRATNDLIPYCHEHGIAVLPYSVLAKGLLTGSFTHDSVIEDLRARDPEFVGRRFRANLQLVARLTQIAADISKSVTQLAIQWTLSQPGVTASIVGAKRPSQVVENAGGTGWVLEESTHDRIEQILRDHEGET